MAEVDQNKMLQSDPDLIQACRAGDARAWERLLDKYERLVFSISLNHGLTTDDAADAVPEADCSAAPAVASSTAATSGSVAPTGANSPTSWPVSAAAVGAPR